MVGAAIRIVRFLYPLLGMIAYWSGIVPAGAQSPDSDNEAGKLFIRHYTSREYKGFPQNWAGIQDARGVMVFANGDGVLKFDGVAWEFHSLPNLGVVRSVAMDSQGRIYVGAYDELGYLDADTLGNYRYVSLLPSLSEREFGDVYKIYCVSDSVIFQSRIGLLIYRNGQFTTIRLSGERDTKRLFLSSGIVYVQRDSIGLCILNENGIKSAHGGEFFLGKKVREILPFDETYHLVVTAEHGLYLYDGSSAVPLRTEIDDFLIRNKVYCAAQLLNGDYAIGTLTGGAFIIDRKARVKAMLNRSTGLGDNEVLNFCVDRQGGLWAELSHGISRIETHTAITHFQDDSGPGGSVNAIARFQGTLYVGTPEGLYKLDPAKLPERVAHFTRVSQINTGIWAMVDVPNALIINTENGAFILEQNQFRKINNNPAYSIFRLRSDRNIIISGLSDGLSILERVNGQWRDGGRISGIDIEATEIEESTDGSLWVSTYSEGIFRLEFNTDQGKTDYLNPSITHFGQAEGLKGGYTRIFRIGDRELFFEKRNEARDQLYLYDKDNKQFIEYNNFAPDLGLGEIPGFPLTRDINNRFWIRDTNPDDPHEVIIATHQSDGSFAFKKIGFSRLGEFSYNNVYEEGDIAWLGGHDGLVRVEISKIENKPPTPFDLQIDRILFSNDSVLFRGTNKPLQYLTFPYDLNSIRFEYAAMSYDAHNDNQYQYMLDGFDGEWSAWTKETNKYYTRIPEGSYVFKVRGKNIYGETSGITSYVFAISPPWYRSWWMYAFYLMALGSMVAGLLQWRSVQLKKEKENLEKLVTERTAEVKAQAEQLKQQAVKLKALDQAKSNFFANISHEFRTPLTIILGLLDDYLEKNPASSEIHSHTVMRQSARRLQNLIDQLLDLSKLEARKLILNIGRGNIYQHLRSIASAFSSFAIQRGISYEILVPEDEREAYFDADKLEKILSNLLSNAFKFTPKDGRIVVRAKVEGDMLMLSVEDTGIGIPSDQVNIIFERFYQIDNSHSWLQEGAGIGLSLVKELTELHGGNIGMESQVGRGAIFIITLPIARENFSGEKITETIDHSPVRESVLLDEEPHDSGLEQQQDDLPILLVVEDNIDLRQFIAGHLEGYHVIEASNGNDGLDSAMTFVPDLIISDIMMPEMDGVELCKKVKEDEKTSHIPVILLTAKADVDSRLEGLETGADDYITKPFEARELQTRVRNLIRQRALLRDRFSRTVILKPQDIAITSPDEVFLKKVMAIVERHLGDSDFTVEDFQKEIGSSRMQLHRKLKALTGHAAGEFMRTQRLVRASEMLTKTDCNITEVCYQTGFTSLSYFAKCFKKQFGRTPKDYAAAHAHL